jgi:hypothetical protein
MEIRKNIKKIGSNAVIERNSVLISEKGFILGRTHLLYSIRNPERPEIYFLIGK